MTAKRCPLCKQPVSEKLFENITGIWKEREKQEKELKDKQIEFIQKQKEGMRKLKQQAKQLKAENIKKIEEQVKARTAKFESEIRQIQANADKKILAAVKAVERKEKVKFQAQLKDKLRISVAQEVKKSTSKILADKKRSDLSLESARKQMSTLQQQSMKQQTKISNLERQLQNKTTPQLEGLLYEDNLMKALQKDFPDDKFVNTGKGGDILHEVIFEKESRGVIVYECKKVKGWSGSHLEQTAKAQLTRKADFAILVTNATKKGTSGFFIEKGVIVINPGGVLAIAHILRNQIIEMARLKLSKSQRNEAIENTIKYLQSPEYKNSLDVVIRKTIEMDEDLNKECQEHLKNWKKRHDSLKTVYVHTAQVKEKTIALLTGQKQENLIIVVKPFPALPELKDE